MLMLGTPGRVGTGQTSGRAAGMALLVSWVRKDQGYVWQCWGRSQGYPWSLWGWRLTFLSRNPSCFPQLRGSVCLCVCVSACVCVCVCLSVSIFGDWHRSSETERKGLRPIRRGQQSSMAALCHCHRLVCWVVSSWVFMGICEVMLGCVCGWGPASVPSPQLTGP